MDPPLVSESSHLLLNDAWHFSFTAAAGGGDGRNLCPNLGIGFPETFGVRDGSAAEESTVTEQSGRGASQGRKRRDFFCSEDESSKIVSTTESGNELSESNGKKTKLCDQKCETGDSEPELGSEQNNKQQPSEDYVYVRARRGQATDNHSLAERARREKISERMKILQNLVPGCDKVIGKALVLDEIINYVQSLQQQVEFLSMKLEAVNSRISMNPAMKGFHSKDFGAEPCGADRMMLSSQAVQESIQGPLHEWLNIQVGGHFDRPSQ